MRSCIHIHTVSDAVGVQKRPTMEENGRAPCDPKSGYRRDQSRDSRGAAALVTHANEDVEDLLPVGAGPGDREAEVERDRRGAERRNGDAEAEAGRHAVIGDVDPRFRGARVDEGYERQAVVGQDRNLVLDAVEEEEGAAEHEAVLARADAAELEAAD